MTGSKSTVLLYIQWRLQEPSGQRVLLGDAVFCAAHWIEGSFRGGDQRGGVGCFASWKLSGLVCSLYNECSFLVSVHVFAIYAFLLNLGTQQTQHEVRSPLTLGSVSSSL